MIVINKSQVERVERGVMVSFEQCVTLPILVGGREVVAYVGITRLGRAAGSRATTADVVEAGVRLVAGMELPTEVAVSKARQRADREEDARS
jgi:hypothetical protein